MFLKYGMLVIFSILLLISIQSFSINGIKNEGFAEQINKIIPIITHSKVLTFSGSSHADVKNSSSMQLTDYTISLWFSTQDDIESQKEAFLINKGGTGTERSGFNMNYGIWLSDKEKIIAGFETIDGDDVFVSSQGSYNNGKWYNVVNTFDSKLNEMKLYVDGFEVASNKTDSKIMPDNTGKQPIRIGANSLTEKGKINGNFTGQLDDIHIFDKALTKIEIEDLYKRESSNNRT
ncbi:MAG: LamG domain-containing protein [Nitrososphaeraceae archaeon]